MNWKWYLNYGMGVKDWKPIINTVVTKGEKILHYIIPYWWMWTEWDSLKAFLFGEVSLIKSYWTYE